MHRDEGERRPHTGVIVGLGELIWDLLPGGKQLGGAPSNFAYVSHLLGASSVVASRTGDDALGHEARQRLEASGISARYLQQDAGHPTGTVGVRIDETGEPLFSINENSAWDYLEWTPQWAELAGRADAVCFGTLGQRNPRARTTILRFLRETRPAALRVFDVNLRHAFFTREMLAQSLALATVVKLNIDELSTASTMLGLNETDAVASAGRLLNLFPIEIVAVTRGSRGSLLVTQGNVVEHPGLPVRVVDTIGAGDAFTATLAHYHLRRAPLPVISDAANRVGAWMAAQAGATPPANRETLARALAHLA